MNGLRRAFVAVVPPPEVLEAVERVVAPVRPVAPLRLKWTHAGHEKICKDANDLAQYHFDEKIEPSMQTENVRNVFHQAEPIVLLAAKYAGRQQGADRQKALDVVLPLIKKMPKVR